MLYNIARISLELHSLKNLYSIAYPFLSGRRSRQEEEEEEQQASKQANKQAL